MKALTTTTATGREVTLRTKECACILSIVADIPSLGVRDMVVRRGRHNGQEVLFGHATVQGKHGTVGIAITPDIAAWLREFEVEAKALSEARMEVFYMQGWEGHTEVVDSRLSDDEIIASMPAGFWGEENTPESFRECLQKARAERTAKAEAQKRDNERIEAAKAEAARTGQDVLVREYVTACDGSEIECSTDVVREYVRPDGTIRIQRIHTF